MAHIDYDRVSTLDLFSVSDAGAREALVRLRERLEALDPTLESRIVFDGMHRGPVLAWYRGDDAVLHVWPEANVQLGLHCLLPIRASERRLLDLRELPERAREAVERARPRHNMVWVDRIVHGAADADEIVEIVARRIELLPTVH